ncbi:MAG: DUF480 domain-containing protein [Candidatus Latescibacteria bacterium]|nr:DUF480 domain-containing protein [Candidatus Latescibacterota bacterium]
MTDTLFDPVEVRVLGALVEKKFTTPEYYPLTLNALRTACNQKSNRDPVVDFDDKTVVRALESLRDKQLARQVSGGDQRVPRYYHLLHERLDLEVPALAALCVLMLRGPQTTGEIRGRSARLHEFADLDAVEAVLTQLTEREETLAILLPRQAGRKERRYAHLLTGPPEVTEEEGEGPVEAATLEVRAENQRLADLEEEVERLRAELEALQEEFRAFKGQFD